MKAITQDTYGSYEVLSLRDVDHPIIGDKDVLIRVCAAGVDAGVWHLMSGEPYLLRLMGFGLSAPKVAVRGLDVAGVVEAVGKAVTRFKPGDEVYGNCDGSFAEYACGHEDRLALKPTNLDFVQASVVPISAVTALKSLRDVGKVQPGQKVLVIGAAGGVGSFAVQLAKSFGAEVTGVCSTSKIELVRSIGADHVVDYTREDFTQAGLRYDLILDTAGNRPLALLRSALTPQGTLVLIGGEGDGRWVGDAVLRTLRAVLLSPFISQKLIGVFALVGHEDLQTLTTLIQAGQIKPIIDTVYPLSEAAQAIRHQREGRARGKVALQVA